MVVAGTRRTLALRRHTTAIDVGSFGRVAQAQTKKENTDRVGNFRFLVLFKTVLLRVQARYPSSTEIGESNEIRQINLTAVRDIPNRLRIANESNRPKTAKFQA